MEAGPPVLIERAVRALIPRPCREHVLGDLRERYASPRQYTAEALRTLPYVVVSQARLNTTRAVVAMQAVILFAAFDGLGVLALERPLLRTIVPAAVALLALLLRDAYSGGSGRAVSRAVIDIIVAGFAVAAVETGLHALAPALVFLPNNALDLAAGTSGFRRARGPLLIATAILFLLRMGSRRELRRLDYRDDLDVWEISQSELEQAARKLERNARNRQLIELAWGGVSLVALLVLFLSAGWTTRPGLGLSIAGVLYVLAFSALCRTSDTAATARSSRIQAHRDALESHEAVLRRLARAYVVPLFPGAAGLTLGLAITADLRSFVPPLQLLALVAASAGALALWNLREARRLAAQAHRLITADEIIIAKPRGGRR